MGRRVLAIAGVALLLPLAASWSAPGPDAEVKAILARAVEARGGAAFAAKYRAVTAKVHTTDGFGDSRAIVIGTIRVQFPDKSRFEGVAKDKFLSIDYTQILNGDKCVSLLAGNVHGLGKELEAITREELYADSVANLHGLTGPGFQLAPLGTSKVGDKTVVGVRVSSKGHGDVSLYFDKETGLLLKRSRPRNPPSLGLGCQIDTLYSDYRNVSGILFPYRVTEKWNGQPHHTTDWSDFSVAESFPDGTFDKP
jgi:hypothetical protein